jgi:hypothetical protein
MFRRFTANRFKRPRRTIQRAARWPVGHYRLEVPPPGTYYQLWKGVTPENLDWKEIHRLWRQELEKWGPFETETDTCAIDPLYGRAVLGCDDGVIRVFDIHTGETLREIAAHDAGIKKVAVSPANKDILSAAYDQKILIWDAKDFRQKIRLESKRTVWERSFNWAPDGKEVVAGTFDGTVLVWDAAAGQCIAEIGKQTHQPGNTCFNDVSANANGDIALVSDDGFVRTAKALRIHPHRPLGVSCSADGILVSWELDGNLIRHFKGHTAIIDDVDIDPEGNRVVSVGRDFVLKIHRLDNGEILHALSLGKHSPKGVCFFDENTVVVTNYWGELIKVTLPGEKILRRHLSHVMARKTGNWHNWDPGRVEQITHLQPPPKEQIGSGKRSGPGVELDPVQLQIDFEEVEYWQEKARTLLSHHPMPGIFYEDLHIQFNRTCETVLQFLNIEPRELQAAVKKLETRTLSESIVNYTEIKSIFAGTRWAHFFED